MIVPKIYKNPSIQQILPLGGSIIFGINYLFTSDAHIHQAKKYRPSPHRCIPMAPSKIESASEISKRYGLAGLVKARILARRLALNAMARRMSASMHDSLELFYPDLVPMEPELVSPRNYLLALDQPEEELISRSALHVPAYETRLYNRRLTEMEAVHMDDTDRADRLLDRYLTRSRARAAILDNSSHQNEEEDDVSTKMNTRSGALGKTAKEHGGKDFSETDRNEDMAEEDEINDILEHAYENNYLDLMTSTYDHPDWRRARRRLLRRRLLPYTLRSLTATNRLLARRGLLE